MLFARGHDIQKVMRGKLFVHELIVTYQREDGLVLVGQKVLLDTQVTRPGDDQDVLVVGVDPDVQEEAVLGHLLQIAIRVAK